MAAQNTGDDLTSGQTNHEQSGLELVADPDRDGKFGNDFIFRVVQSSGLFSFTPPIDGIRAQASDGRGVFAFSSGNDGVVGQSTAGGSSGVVGINDSNVGVFGRANGGRAGVLGSSTGGGAGVEGESPVGAGVLGESDSGNGVVGTSNSDAGVSGMSNSGVGVRGGSNLNDGVSGVGTITGVRGQSTSGAGVTGGSTSGRGGLFTCDTGIGVDAESNSGVAVLGKSTSNAGGFFNSLSAEALVAIAGGPGDGVHAQSVKGSGVSATSTDGAGVFGDSQNQVGVAGRSRGSAAAGVFGLNDQFIGVSGGSTSGLGVFGHSQSQAGVMGTSISATGVFGFGDAAFQGAPAVPPAGVLGVNDKSVGVLGSSVGVIGAWGNTDKGLGVLGTANLGAGVPTDQITDQGIGVIGLGNSGFGVAGMSTSGTGVFGSSTSGLAGHFKGGVTIEGALTVVGGAKSAAVPHPDGSHRQLYCVESPESWFEDFGEAKLVDGQAEVPLDPGFAALVEVNGYHVFLTPYGESKGMFVAERYKTGFRVLEQQGGASNLNFAYRVVAKRKDVAAGRLAKVALPQLSSARQFPDLRLEITPPDPAVLTVAPPLPPSSSTSA